LEKAHRDPVAVTGHRLVDRVVDHLVHEVVQTPARRGADVHPGAEPNVLDALEDLDIRRSVLSGLGRRRPLGPRTCHFTSVMERGRAGLETTRLGGRRNRGGTPWILPIGGDAERISTPHPRRGAGPRTPCATSLSAGRRARPPAPWRRSRGRSPSGRVRGSVRPGTEPARPRVRWSRRPPGRRVRDSPGRTPRPTGGPPPTPNRTRAGRSACLARTS